MKMNERELNERLAEADRKIVMLRKATLELAALGREIVKQRTEQHTHDVDRSERSDSSPDRRVPGA